MRLNIVGGAYSLDAVAVDNQRCINWMVQAQESGGGQNALIPCDGLRLTHTLDSAVIGMRTLSNGKALAVTSSKVWLVTRYAATEIGVIDPATFATVADNGIVAVIGTDTALYSVALDTMAVTQVLNEPRPYIDFLDGYFVFLIPETGQYAWTKLYSTVIDPLNFATAEGDPDILVALKVVGREMWAFGTNSTEIYYNSGDLNLPFRRVGGAFLDVGCEAPRSLARLANSLIFVARTESGGRFIATTQGYQAVRISTHAIENDLNQVDVSDASAYSYQNNGHGFYVLNIPALNKTYCFDAATGFWHQRAWRDPVTGALSRHRAQHHAYIDGANLASDYENGKIYTFDARLFTDDGDPIYRERTIPETRSESRNLKYDRFEAHVNSQSVNTLEDLYLSWSDDHGRNWSNDRPTSLGRRANELVRIAWRRLGMSRARIFRISTTAAQNVALIDAYLQVTEAER